jgi:BON domain-containing protein
VDESAFELENVMIELPFGSVPPMWSGVPPLAWPQMGSPVMNRMGPGFGSPPVQPMTIGNMTSFRSPQPFGAGVSEPYGVGGPIPFTGAGFAPVPTPFMYPAGYPGIFTPGIPGLLAAVAIRRGQPAGPTTDQEIEDFIYDVFELLPGTNDVEVRGEGGRVTLTGSVQHKRLKHDVGEIVWAIPTINDVQNNVAISTKRRTRSGSREGEPTPSPRKQA